MNKTGLIAKISIKYVLPTCIWKYFWWNSRYFALLGEFRGISRKCLNFAGPRPREISEALFLSPQLVYIFSIFTLTLVLPQQHRLHTGGSRGGARGAQAQGDCPPFPPLLSQVWIRHCYRNAINWTGLKAKIVQAPVVQKVDNNNQWIDFPNIYPLNSALSSE